MKFLKRSALLLWSSLCLLSAVAPSFAEGAPSSTIAGPLNKTAKVSAAKTKVPPVSAYEKGAVAFGRKDYRSALSSFESALAEHPNDPNVHYGLASVFTAVGNEFQAKCFYQSCIALAPQSKLAQNAKAGLAYLDTLSTSGQASPAQSTSEDSSSSSSSSAPSVASAPSSSKRSPFTASGLIPPLPAPTPGRYAPPDQQTSYSPGGGGGGSGFQQFGGRHRHHGQGQFGQYNQQFGQGGGGYSPSYSSSYYRAQPHLEVKNYNFPPSTSTAAANSEQSQVEYLAKQSKLVVDEKSSH